VPSVTSVGAILRFLLGLPCPGPSSLSLSLAAPASLFTPLTELAVLRGVCGGVVIDMPEAKLEVVAVMEGMLPATRGGLLITVADCGAKDD
jgi:hypothetical protein